MKKRCLLLGGAGFIGKNLALHLKEMGYKVTVYDYNVIDRYTTDELDGMDYIQGNFFQTEEFKTVLESQDVVIHLISSVNPSTSMSNPVACYQNDLCKTVELLEAMKDCNIKRMIYISSGGTVYGNIEADYYSEDMPTNPINHYGILKLSVEKMLLMYNHVYGMDNIVLRIANPYGVGQNPSKKIGAVTVFMDEILNDREIVIYGDGNIVRDYIYIGDVVSIIEKAVAYESLPEVTPVFNVGTGKGESLNTILEILGKELNKEPKVKYIKSRGIDVSRNVLDMSKTVEAFGIEHICDINRGIHEYVNVYRGNIEKK